MPFVCHCRFSGPLPTCSRERKDDLEWPTTGAYSHFVQPCPSSAFDSGEVRRFCRLMDSTLTRWDEPDFSACFSQRFFDTRLKVSVKLKRDLTRTDNTLYRFFDCCRQQCLTSISYASINIIGVFKKEIKHLIHRMNRTAKSVRHT